jgi:hypothetical protein
MANRPWLDEVRQRLVNHALPPAYIRRFLEELTDHLQDLKEETMHTDVNVYARLGDAKQVAESAAAAYRRRSFLGRHPVTAFLVFAVSPVVAFVILFLAATLGLFLAARGLGYKDHLSQLHTLGWSTFPLIQALATLVLPAILLCILYCRLGRRLGVSRKWMYSSCVILAALAALCQSSVIWSDIPGKNQLTLGLGLFSLMQPIQFLVPFVFGWWFIRRQHRLSQPPCPA